MDIYRLMWTRARRDERQVSVVTYDATSAERYKARKAQSKARRMLEAAALRWSASRRLSKAARGSPPVARRGAFIQGAERVPGWSAQPRPSHALQSPLPRQLSHFHTPR